MCNYLFYIAVDQCKIDFELDQESCSGHGLCTNDDSDDKFTCLCAAGWLGSKCEDSMY